MHKMYNINMEMRAVLRTILEEFVSDIQVADIYAALVQYGPQTISELSRSSGVERTRVYRNLHELQSLQLVEIELQPHRQIIQAANLQNLENTLAKKRANLDILATQITKFQNQFGSVLGIELATKVRFFRGQSGIEQMLWNQTKAKSEIISILSENLQSHTKRAFFERWVDRCNERGLVTRSIVDDTFIAAQKQWYGGAFSHSLKNWSARKMPSSLSEVPHRTTIYDNVTTYFSWQDDDLFGIEIHNQNIADTQRQHFELLWKKSKPLQAKPPLPSSI
jgi:sugar-specific transcriptional regulator TrmB